MGILIGVLVGLIVSLFRILITLGFSLNEYVFFQAHQFLFIWFFIIPIYFLIGYFLVRLVKKEPNIKGSGIPQVEAQLIDAINIKWLSVLIKKFLGGILSISTGLMLGREGPSIQLGAAIGQGISEIKKMSKSETKILISAGAAAGLSAAFNAPIAAILFVVEEMHHNFSNFVWISAFIASLTADFVSMEFFGLKPILHFTNVEPLSLKQYPWLITMGILIGILAIIYQRNTLALPAIFKKIPFSDYLDIFIPLIMIIPSVYFVPQLIGGGNQLILSLDKMKISFLLLITLFLFRYVYSMISYGSGLPGGIFLPILTLGAIIGYLFYKVLFAFGIVAYQEASVFIVIGMASYFGSISMAPLTSIILVTEMVGNLEHIMPLGLTTLVAYLVVDSMGGQAIYESMMMNLLKNNSYNNFSKQDRQIYDFPVTVDSSIVGKNISEIKWPKGCLVIYILRNSKRLSVNGDTKVVSNDHLICLINQTYLSDMKKILN
ncbi:MAG: chloride channel protein [Oenococcus oeni]